MSQMSHKKTARDYRLGTEIQGDYFMMSWQAIVGGLHRASRESYRSFASRHLSFTFRGAAAPSPRSLYHFRHAVKGRPVRSKAGTTLQHAVAGVSALGAKLAAFDRHVDPRSLCL